MDYAASVALLRRIPVFASLDGPSIKLLAFSSTALTLHDGEALCRQGDPGDSVFVIDQGQVDVFIMVEGRSIHLATLGNNDLFGEMAVICNLPRTATVVARGPLKVLKIEADVFLQLVTANPEASLGVMRVLSEKLMRLTERYERLKRSLPEENCPKAPSASG